MRLQSKKQRGLLSLGLTLALILTLVLAFGLYTRTGAAADSATTGGEPVPQPLDPSPLGPGEPTIIVAEHSDESPPLSTIEPAERPPAGEVREIPFMPSPALGFEEGAGLDPVVQRSLGPTQIPTPTLNFAGVGNVDGVLPPDMNGDVGPNNYVQMVNLSFAIWDKSGNLLLGPVPNNTLWQGFGGPCEANNDGDPIVFYDHLADRWVLSQFAVSGGASIECIAVSTTGDPTGSYYRYEFDIGAFPDYPKLALWPEAYLATFRVFGAEFDLVAGGFNRSKMLLGDPTAEIILFSISDFFDIGVDGFLPAQLSGIAPPPDTPAPFLGLLPDEQGFDDDYLAMFQMEFDWANPSNSTFDGPMLLETAPFDPNLCDYSRDCIPQPGTDQGLDAISQFMMYRLVYRYFGFYEAIAATHTVDVGNDHAGERWYELRDSGSGWDIFQQGTYAPDDENRWMGSIAMDQAGNIALGYTVSSDTVYPSIRYTGRLATDPLGVMAQGEAEVIAGGGSQLHPSGRWGDYSSLVVDQFDDCTFWFTHEYIPQTGNAPWETRIAAFKFDECPTGLTPDFSLWAQPESQAVCAPDSATFDLTVFSIAGFNGDVTLSASGVPTGYAASFGTNPVTAPATTTLSLNNTGAATAGTYDITVTGDAVTQTHTTTATLELFTEVPDAPTLVSPGDGAVNQSIRPVLEWMAAPDATSYLVEVATDAAFTNVIESATVPDTMYQVSTNLDFDTTYYWRVSANNVCGAGATSAVFSFTTAGDMLICPAGSELVTTFQDDLDPPAAGWTHEAVVGTDTWTLTSANPSPGSGGDAWYSQDLPNPGDQRLLSPVISVPNQGDVYLEFWNEQNFENPAGSAGCWDGGLLEISTDGGTTWTILDTELLTDPYDGFGNNGPPAGLPLWCGETGGFQPWTNSIVDLSGYAGQDVTLRFRNVSDAASGAEGWYIDDVQVSYCTEPLQAAIAVTKTVGLDPTTCATQDTLVIGQPNTDVTYCYTVENTGDVTLTEHTVVDDKLGDLLTNFAFDLGPGETTFFTTTANITQSVTNVVTWTASIPGGPTATATDTASVSEQPTAVTLSGFGDDVAAEPARLWMPLLLVMLVGAGLVVWRRRKSI